MKEFILNGDVVKRLLYNRPINDESYEQDFSTWIINENQPSDGIVVTKNKISISKFKPNEWIIKSNYDDMSQDNFLDKFYNKDFILSGLDEARADNKINVVLDNPTGNTSQTYHAYGLVISPINSNGVLMTHVYPWDMNIPNGYFKNAVGYYNSWNVYGYSKNETKKLYNWSCYWANYNQVAFAIYTSVTTDVDGFVELNTPIEISVPNIAIVDPTTQEAFKLYNKNELLYERDRNVENLYKVFNLLKNDVQTYKSSWQKEKEDNDGETFDGNIAYIFTIEDYDYQKISLPVATDLVQKIQEFVPFKFNITQYDYGRNEFWKTIVQTINNIQSITDYTFCYKLFKNAIGLAELDWDTIGDQTLHGIVINIGQNNQYFVVDECFAYCDIPAVTINDAGGTLKSIHDLFKYSSVKHIKFGAGIVLHDIIGAFEATRSLEDITGLAVINVLGTYNGKYLSDRTLAIAYSFEGAGLESLNIDGEDIVVYPYCPQVFGSSCGLKTITGSAFDFKFVDPADISSWGVGAWYGHQIFGNSILESIKIKNLNKGNWTIPMPLNNTSVNYLLNNIYDLTSNDGEHLERDDNSFNGWSHSYTNQETHKTIRFNHGYYAQIIKTNWNGRKIFKLKASVATQISLMLKDQGTIVLNQQFNVGTSETVIDRSANTFDEVRIGINLQNSQNDIDLTLSDPFDSAASNVTSATLTFTQVQYDSEFDAAIAVAQARGWTIQFAS